ncbi:MAG: hypothetical protein J6Y77_06575, partial [Paludibacteraceae bacterium]|nr:hypothetical protein [Paludibacteraceae bacterium]
IANIANFHAIPNLLYGGYLLFLIYRKKHQEPGEVIPVARRVSATLICLLIAVPVSIVYTQIIFYNEETNKKNGRFEETIYGFTDRNPQSVIEYEYIDKKKSTLEAIDCYCWSDRENLIFPDSIVKDKQIYKVLSVAYNWHNLYLKCDTLYLPASLVYLDERLLNSESTVIHHIVVAPGNRHYQSVNGNLYRGDVLLYDTQSSFHE